MKSALILLALTGIAAADTRAAEGWVKAMTESGAPPTLKKPLAYTLQSEQCPKLTTGKVSTAPELAPIKACFVATWGHVAKEAVVEYRVLKQKDLDGRQLRWNKTAPKGTAWVRANREYAGQALTITMALGGDAVIAVWLSYAEHDGE